jgi:hypothetical protein
MMLAAHQPPLLIGAALVAGVAADPGSDFSNNLFSDLGPYVHDPS